MQATSRGTVARWMTAGALIACALALWLSAGSAGMAATASYTQSLAATVSDSISFGTVAGTCTQNTPTALDLGAVTPGVYKQSPTQTACVSSNSTYNVTATGTTAMTTTGGATIPLGNTFIVQMNDTWVPNDSRCESLNCALSAPRSLVVNGPPATGVGLQYMLGVQTPANQQGGSYSGGLVTFTASNG